ncbi:MAG: alginate lyase family protein [Ignavibacteriales bacterium]|nr:alginate lyase family protein [Ignavibacteriales bacterium]
MASKNPKNLKSALNIINHRIIKPRWWRTFLRERTTRLTDESFKQFFPSTGSNQEFLAQFHSAVRLRFFFHPRNQKDFFLQLITSTQNYEDILAEAQNVLENKFETLGSGLISLGTQIDWQKDFKSGKAWPFKPSSELDVLDVNNSSDVKVPWELSRFHQVWWLGKAYWLTRNEQYAIKFRELVEDWIEKNPPGVGINWVVAMEVAIRACSWIAGYYFFCESKSLSEDFWMKFLKSLYAHGIFIECNQEMSWQNGNHFLSDIVGLIFLGIFFRQTPFGKRWIAYGAKALEKEMNRQVYSDGVNYEKSTSYHRLVLELFYSATILCRKNNVQLSQSFSKRLELMFEFVQQYTRPDGSVPLIGDADDGRLFRFSMNEDMNDHRHALSVGSILFERSSFKNTAGKFSQDALWLFGGEGFEQHQLLRAESPPLSSRGFAEGGFYILRSNDAHVFFDAGDIGMNGRGGHGHNDTLSFELWAHGAPLVVDSGTYAYTFDTRVRQEFRSTRAHNTIVIDNAEIAEFASLWSIKEDGTNPKVLEWKSSAESDILEVQHEGYASLPSPVIHRRRIQLMKEKMVFQITDCLEGNGAHNVESFLHFAPAVTLELQGAQKAMAINKNGRYIITASAGELSIVETWYSRSYGVREKNKTLRFSLNVTLPIEVQIMIEQVPGFGQINKEPSDKSDGSLTHKTP